MKKTINDITKEDIDKAFQSPTGRVRKFFKRLFCDHKWEDGRHLPDKQSFICSKCGEEFWWYPEK